ncbi:dethiobiotin synthase [Brevibacillus fortis]|uniref:ATP-dependent dethiobiotin synthetase BioD n=1 Tax=Brevibacillus fortis TaxID=2126352 RepID=A0A2P7V6K8_9BACL|nr:dethiobiotin synthase [Brevibacillus fortis]MED1784333.1 dethiobiotin synthase [Brevibacillus fortis]PSJ94845.1 dethiobiotin synthase [Brevibacillus fortis]
MSERPFCGLFVTGTDTGVGKTVVTAGIASVLRETGVNIGVWKPVQSGARAHDENSDARHLRSWSGVPDSCEEIAPLCFEAPLTPLLAAEAEGKSLTVEEVIAAGRPLMERYPALLVEGAGGLIVPLTRTETMADLAVRLNLPMLIVARAGLGTINHTLLSVWYARELGIEVVGVILNQSNSAGVTDESVKTNASMIESYGGVPVWGVLPWINQPLERQQLTKLIHECVDIGQLCQWSHKS